MRLFSILLAGVFLTVAGCGGGDDAASPAASGGGGATTPPSAGMDPGGMETDPIKDKEGKEVKTGKEEPPPGAKVTPEPSEGAEKKGTAPAKDDKKK